MKTNLLLHFIHFTLSLVNARRAALSMTNKAVHFSSSTGNPVIEPVLLVHGGAGEIAEGRVEGKLAGIKKSLRDAFAVRQKGGSQMDVVEEAVRSMESDENFNAGYGAVLNADGQVEVEAIIIDGNTLKAGCVTMLHDIMHPISVARKVMEKSNHTFIGGESAMQFAKEQGIELLPPGSLVTESAKKALEDLKERQRQGLDTNISRSEVNKAESAPGESGTVGAISIDADGNIVLASSTGGITGKMPGRIGDIPLLGVGTYADNEVGGVATTGGHGDTIMRFNLAHKILEKIKYENMSAQDAAAAGTEAMTKKVMGTGGAIVIDRKGQIGIYFTTKRMAWGYIKGGAMHYGINKGDDFVEKL